MVRPPPPPPSEDREYRTPFNVPVLLTALGAWLVIAVIVLVIVL